MECFVSIIRRYSHTHVIVINCDRCDHRSVPVFTRWKEKRFNGGHCAPSSEFCQLMSSWSSLSSWLSLSSTPSSRSLQTNKMFYPLLADGWLCFLVRNQFYSENVCFLCYILTIPSSCLETAMGRRKYHRGKRVRITGVQWCLSQVDRIMAIVIIVL